MRNRNVSKDLQPKAQIIIFLINLFIYWTYIIVVPDFFMWMLTGSQITEINYNSSRGIILVLWPFIASFIIGLWIQCFTDY